MCLLERRIIHPTYNVTAQKPYSEIVHDIVRQNTLLNDNRRIPGLSLGTVSGACWEQTTTHTADDIKSRYTIWLAHWVDQTNYSGAYGIWQHSEKGSVDGINGNVDLDIGYKDFPTIIKAKGLNGWGKEEVLPNPPAPDTTATVTVTIGKDTYKGTLVKE